MLVALNPCNYLAILSCSHPEHDHCWSQTPSWTNRLSHRACQKVCWHKIWRTVPHTQQAGKRGFNWVPGCFVIRKRASQFDLKKLTRDKTVKCQTGTCQVRPDSSIYTALKPLTTTYNYRKLSANKFINHSANRKMNTRKDPIAECMCMGRHVWTSEINHELMHNQAQQSSRVGVHEGGMCK